MIWIGLVIISALFIGIRDVVSKKMLVSAKPGHIAFSAGFIMLILSLLYFRNIDFVLTLEQFGFVALRAVFLSAGALLLFTAMKQLHLRIYEPMMNVSPIFLVVFAAILLGEILHPMQLVGIALIMISAFSLHFQGTFHLKEIKDQLWSKPMIFMYLGLITITFSAISTKYIGPTMTFSTLMFHYAWMFTLIQGIVLLAQGEFKSMLYTVERNRSLVLIGGVLGFLEASFYMMAVVHPLSLITLLIPLRRLSTLFGTILGGMYYHEGNVRHSAIVSAVMVVGVFIVSWFAIV